jgi:hypothetical protein
LVTNSAARPAGQSTLNPTHYATAPHGNVPEYECGENFVGRMYSLLHKIAPGSKVFFWFLQVGFKYLDDNDSRMTFLLGMSALMEILPGTIDGFELHPLDETSTLPFLTSNWVEDGFPSSAILAFKYCLVRNKQSVQGNSQQAAASNPPVPSPYHFNDKEEFKPSPYLWAVIRVCGNNNIKDSCKEIGWDIQESGLVIRYKEHQSADSNAQMMLMYVPSVFDQDGVEGEILWHFSKIEKSLLKKGKLPTEFVGVPLPEISVSWRQNKQGKGRIKQRRASA